MPINNRKAKGKEQYPNIYGVSSSRKDIRKRKILQDVLVGEIAIHFYGEVVRVGGTWHEVMGRCGSTALFSY